MGIVPIGKALQGYKLTVSQNGAFGGVTPGVHSPSGFHPTDEAIDVTDRRADVGPEYEGGEALSWQERTKRLMQRARQLGAFDEVLGPGDKGHATHVHLARRKDRAPLAAEQLEWLGTGRWKQGDGSYSFAMPNPGNATAAPAPAAGGAAAEPSPAAPAAPDWRAAASDPNRSRDPMSAAYWQREDMKQWAAANPSLARPLMAAAGAGAPLEALPQPSAPAAPAEDYSFKPLSSGATGGVKVAPLPQLNPEMAKRGNRSWQHAFGVALPQLQQPLPSHYQRN